MLTYDIDRWPKDHRGRAYICSIKISLSSSTSTQRVQLLLPLASKSVQVEDLDTEFIRVHIAAVI
jgi:hypothetical protein